MKKTTASVEQAVVMILQSVRRTRSRRRDFCVQIGFGVCTNKHPLAKWIARGIACQSYRKFLITGIIPNWTNQLLRSLMLQIKAEECTQVE